jgi:two-component system chemotaxis sensor kinase CheA
MESSRSHPSTTLHRLPDMQELIHDFIQEALSGLERTEPLVESLGANDIEAIEKNIRILFRSFHSMKGVAGFLQFMVIQDLTHEAETLFDAIRETPQQQPEHILDLIYETFDCLRGLIGEIRQAMPGTTDADDHQHSQIIIEKTHRLIERLKIEHGVQGVDQEFFSALSSSSSPYHTYHIILKEHAATLHIEIHRADALHSVPESDIIVPVVGSILAILNNPIFKSLIQDNEEASTLVQSSSVFADMIVSGDLSLDVAVLTTLHSQIEALIQALGSAISLLTPAETSSALNSRTHPLPDTTEISSENTTPYEEASLHHPEGLEHHRAHSSQQSNTSAERSEIRVETSKLDRLFDLVGELVTMQTMAFNSPDIIGLKLPQFRKSATMLGKITRQLQSVTMSMRMAPVEVLFVKMRRVVREISGRVGKMVELQMNGADTEMDKNLIDLMFDALVHIVRNAIDHGIELPHERLERGKVETGTITLSALYEGNDIVIIVRDDGGGLDRKKILKRATERGIALANNDALTDEEVWNFIFEPGFSTAEVVTDISGRGVGMDVVRQNIERLRGQIHVSSRFGIGTTVTLRIPLTLASMDVMLVRVGSARYAIPLGSVRQSFRPRAGDITTTMDGLEVVRVREVLYPILRLHEVFAQSSDTTDLKRGILVIVESHTRKACVLVDEVIGQQQTVIKSLSQYIGTVYGLSGCMILSDGHIGLILDPEDLIRQAEDRTENVLV